VATDSTQSKPTWHGPRRDWWLHGTGALVTAAVALALALIALFVYEEEEGDINVEPDRPPATYLVVANATFECA